jgi:flagella basal body P-ring formation protein FlgA
MAAPSAGDTVAVALMSALGEHAAGPDQRMQLERLPPLPATLDQRDLTLSDIAFDARSGRVGATITLAGGEPFRVAGRLVRMVDLPVLTRLVAPGEIIGAADVAIVPVRSDRLGQSVVATADELIGRTPRRIIQPEAPVRAVDVQLPIAVHRGDLVTLIVRTRVLTVTAQGKALEDAAKGGAVRVANVKSGRVIDGVVDGPNQVSVPVPGAIGGS